MPLLGFALPHHSLVWIFTAQLANLWLHRSYLSVSLWGLVAFFMLWRWLIRQGYLAYPNSRTKSAVVLATLAILALNISGFNLESAGSFLIASSLLKLIELRTLRDGYIAIFLNFFVLASGFLFSQDILSALWGIGVVVLLLIALISLHYSADAAVSARQLAAQAGKLLLWSLPMMLVLYFLFPRLGPLWSFTLQSDQAKTGLSADMSAADIAELSQSSELAFRVSFESQAVPERAQLYWRALVLDHYDGRRWSATLPSQISWFHPHNTPSPDGLSYEIIQEATAENWLFALNVPLAIEPRTGVSQDNRLVARRPLHQRLRYRVHSQPSATAPSTLSAAQARAYLQFPPRSNPQAQQWVQQWAGLPAATVAQNILSYFANAPFAYTLKPQTYGSHEIDEFLFQRQQGFCAHYAGAMVFLARAAGIPARVVTGYQGGEWNASEGYLSVRQYDAHAWVELWIEGVGWQQFDPTASVALERIQFGLERAVANEGTFLQGQLSAHRFKNINWLNDLRLWADSVEYLWQKWVLSYDQERQSNFLNNLLKLQHYQQGLYVLAASFVLFFMFASALLWWRTRVPPPPPLVRAWLRLQQLGATQGLEIMVGETQQHYLHRLAQRYPALQQPIEQLSQELNTQLYQNPQLSASAEQQLVQAVQQLHQRVKKQAKASR